jgi:hypothetical protein
MDPITPLRLLVNDEGLFNEDVWQELERLYADIGMDLGSAAGDIEILKMLNQTPALRSTAFAVHNVVPPQEFSEQDWDTLFEGATAMLELEASQAPLAANTQRSTSDSMSQAYNAPDYASRRSNFMPEVSSSAPSFEDLSQPSSFNGSGVPLPPSFMPLQRPTQISTRPTHPRVSAPTRAFDDRHIHQHHPANTKSYDTGANLTSHLPSQYPMQTHDGYNTSSAFQQPEATQTHARHPQRLTAPIETLTDYTLHKSHSATALAPIQCQPLTQQPVQVFAQDPLYVGQYLTPSVVSLRDSHCLASILPPTHYLPMSCPSWILPTVSHLPSTPFSCQGFGITVLQAFTYPELCATLRLCNPPQCI